LRDGDIIRFAKMLSDILVQIKNAANPRLAVELGFARMAALDRVVILSQVLGQDPAPISATREPEGTAARESGGPAALGPGGSAPRESVRTSQEGPDLSEVKKKSPPDALADFPPMAAELREPPHSDFAGQTAAATAVLSPALPAVGPAAPMDGGRESIYALPDPDAEADLDRDMEPDPDDPDAPMPIAPPPAMAEPESLTVAAQASPSALPEVWPALVSEFMVLRPLLGSHLRRTRPEWEGGDVPALRVIFLERAAFSLIGDDADFRKSVQAFLVSKVVGSRDFPVRFSLDEAVAGAAAEPIPIPYGAEDPARREPIVNFIRDMFDGRLVG
jgi:hypothetical protein